MTAELLALTRNGKARSLAPMPNGGVPLWLIIKPVQSPYVLVSNGPALRLVLAEDFEANGVAAESITDLSSAQAHALMEHLSYWFEARPAVDPRPEPGTVLRDY